MNRDFTEPPDGWEDAFRPDGNRAISARIRLMIWLLSESGRRIWTDREIATHTGYSRSTVKKVRQELGLGNNFDPPL